MMHVHAAIPNKFVKIRLLKATLFGSLMHFRIFFK